MTSRRKFLRYLIIGTGTFSVGYWGYRSPGSFKKAVKHILVRDLAGLRFNIADIETYATTITEKDIFGLGLVKIQMMRLYNSFPVTPISYPLKKKYMQIRSEIVGNFLLSTNFFYNKMDEKKDIVYSGVVYKPYESSCVNPFSGSFYQRQSLVN